MNFVRALVIVLTLIAVGALASGYKVLAWVKFDPSSKTYSLSSGQTISDAEGAQFKPGQFVEVQGRTVIPKTQWRSPQDIEVAFHPQGASRVTFSHERHFGMIGSKDCMVCHADEKGLGSGKPWPSKAISIDLEPHGEKSTARFCSTCHTGTTRAAEIEGTKPPLNVKIFTAFGRKGDASCNHCHVPTSHGSDFTAIHREFAGNAQTCASCHRGGVGIKAGELVQALDFVKAQVGLSKNPEDASAFGHKLPNHFCAYCHATQDNFWEVKIR
jgi:Cytochrome c7 and related cytochrome c